LIAFLARFIAISDADKSGADARQTGFSAACGGRRWCVTWPILSPCGPDMTMKIRHPGVRMAHHVAGSGRFCRTGPRRPIHRL